MKLLTLLLIHCLFVVLAVKFTTAHVLRNIVYPVIRRNESVIDNFYGTNVADPYRWLENPYSEETKQFVEAENEISRWFLEKNDKWEKINEKLTTMWNYTKYTVPQRKGKHYFYFMNTGLQSQFVLYKQSSLIDEPTVVLDSNTLSDDGTISLRTISYSEDGNIIAYTISELGSDWVKIRFRNIETNYDYPDLLERAKFTSLAWTHDNAGLFYNRYDHDGNGFETDLNDNQKLYYHRIGDPQEKDVLIVEFVYNPTWLVSAMLSSNGKYLIVSPGRNHWYFADLEKNGPITGKIPIAQIFTDSEDIHQYVTHTGSKAVFLTNRNAPNYRLVVIDFNNLTERNWTTLVEEDPNDVLKWATAVDGNKIVLSYLHDVKSTLQVNSLETGKLIRKFPLEIGQIVAFSGSKKYSEIFYQLESFLTPGIIYQYNFSTPNTEPTVMHEEELHLNGFNRDDFKVEQIFYISRDGTRIPMYIVQKKASSNEPKPCLINGYGGFHVSQLPSFSVSFLFFIHTFNGILAIPNIRGGGEYGKKWHNAGRLHNKQNVFDDFQAAAKYLIEHNYTEKRKIAIKGDSNGGLLVGACINQRPDLFGAAIAKVGVMDMLRFHKFTVGQSWFFDFGNPDEKTDFEHIYKYSPLHNVHAPNSTENQYPSTLIITADHDDRVSPLHSLKFAASLQNAIRNNQFQRNPILLRVYSKTGHGAGKPTAKIIEENTDILSFLYQALQINAVV